MLAHLAGDGGKQARLTRKSTKETVKTIAQGRPGETASTCGDYHSCGFLSPREAAGAGKAPGFPCALFRFQRVCFNDPDAWGPREYAGALGVRLRHCER